MISFRSADLGTSRSVDLGTSGSVKTAPQEVSVRAPLEVPMQAPLNNKMNFATDICYTFQDALQTELESPDKSIALDLFIKRPIKYKIQ